MCVFFSLVFYKNVRSFFPERQAGGSLQIGASGALYLFQTRPTLAARASAQPMALTVSRNGEYATPDGSERAFFVVVVRVP